VRSKGTSPCAKRAIKDGLEWIEAIPKSQDSGFEKVRLGFAGNDLRAMELFDSLGQTTSLLFPISNAIRAWRRRCSASSPPANTDVIGE
jgi:outer membrane lipoprotein carrier protein